MSEPPPLTAEQERRVREIWADEMLVYLEQQGRLLEALDASFVRPRPPAMTTPSAKGG